MKMFLGLLLMILWIYCLTDTPGKMFDKCMSSVYEENVKVGHLLLVGISICMGCLFTLAFWLLV